MPIVSRTDTPIVIRAPGSRGRPDDTRQMTWRDVARWLPYVGLATVDCVATAMRWDKLRWLTKPALMPVLAATVLPRAGVASSVRAATAVALAASAVGDIALRGTSSAAFITGMGGFLVAQGGWSAACTAAAPGGNPLAATPAALILAADSVILARRAGPFAGPAIAYCAALNVMLACALRAAVRLPGRRGVQVASGALLFVLSDHILGLDRFDLRSLRYGDVLVMATYTAAQGLLAAGLADVPPASRTRQ